jgi:hypothetical protein
MINVRKYQNENQKYHFDRGGSDSQLMRNSHKSLSAPFLFIVKGFHND